MELPKTSQGFWIPNQIPNQNLEQEYGTEPQCLEQDSEPELGTERGSPEPYSGTEPRCSGFRNRTWNKNMERNAFLVRANLVLEFHRFLHKGRPVPRTVKPFSPGFLRLGYFWLLSIGKRCPPISCENLS